MSVKTQRTLLLLEAWISIFPTKLEPLVTRAIAQSLERDELMLKLRERCSDGGPAAEGSYTGQSID